MKATPFASLDWDNRNRLRLRCGWYAEDGAFVTLDYGNGNSDPVWAVGVEVADMPGWLSHPWRTVADRLVPAGAVSHPVREAGLLAAPLGLPLTMPDDRGLVYASVNDVLPSVMPRRRGGRYLT